MKKIMAFALATLLMVSMFSGCGKKKYDNLYDKVMGEGVLVVATSPDNAPYEFKDLSKTGQDSIVGADMMMAKYIADYLGVKLQLEEMEFGACQGAVEMKSVDCSIAGYGVTEKRKETYNLAGPYTWEPSDGKGQTLIVKKGMGATYNSAAAFDGKIVGAQNGSLQEGLVDNQLNCTKEPIGSLNEGILSLMNDKMDALACATDVAKEFCENYDGIELADWYFEYNSPGSAILVAKGEDKLTEKINEALKKAEEEGMFQKWLNEAKELSKEING